MSNKKIIDTIMHTRYRLKDLKGLLIVVLLVLVLPMTALIGLNIRKPQSSASVQTSVATAIETESGIKSGSVETGNDTTASGGQYILFAQTVPTATVVPTIPLTPTSVVFTPTPSPVQTSVSCDFTIATNVNSADGLGNYSSVKPGNTVCIASGNRGGLQLSNFTGTAAAPIIFINHGGVVNISASGDAIQAYSVHYVRITGSGDPNNFYGIMVSGGTGAAVQTNHSSKQKLNNGDDGSDHLEIDHFRSFNTDAGIRSAKNNDLVGTGRFWTGTGFSYHDNYIDTTHGEGMYIGTSTTTGEYPIYDIHIYNNKLFHTGYDGIQLRQAHGASVEVHHNYISETGVDACKNGSTDNSGGFNIAKGTDSGDWYSNTVINGHNGAYIKDANNIRFYNNLLIDSGHPSPTCTGALSPAEGGINLINDNNVKIFNNTIVNLSTTWRNNSYTAAYGISADNSVTNSTIRDNIVTGLFGALIKNSSSSTFTNNLTNSNSSFFQFVGSGNYHLTSGSPAVDAASDSSLPSLDFDGGTRPQGAKSDVGAYEFH